MLPPDRADIRGIVDQVYKFSGILLNKTMLHHKFFKKS